MKRRSLIFLLAMTVPRLMEAAGTPPSLPRITTYEAGGVLRGIDRRNAQATIAHETIPGFMPAMTMSFEVRDPDALSALEPGDTLAFRLCVTADRSWIEQVRKTGRPRLAEFRAGNSHA